MEREDVIKFTNSIILLSKLLTKMEDRFLKQKLHGKLSNMISAFVEQKTGRLVASHNSGIRNTNNTAKPDDIVQRPNNVAQYRQLNLLNSINNTLDYLEYLAHISKNNITPLLLAQRNLLKFKLHILKRGKVEKVSSTLLTSAVEDLTPDVASTMETRLHTSPSPGLDVVNSSLLVSKPLVRTKLTQLMPKSNSNKERIFSFIKKTPDVRAKDVMSKFSALSGRTVKRNLKELTDDGLLKKEKSENGAVHYLTAK